MTWLDTRVKFIGDSAIVELRLPSTQPTIEEELVLMLVYIGRLHYSQTSGELLIPINMVKENRFSAMLYGLKKLMWFSNKNSIPVKLPAKVGLALELDRAKLGLKDLGLLSVLNQELLEEMLLLGSPSDRLSRHLSPKDILSVDDMEEALVKTGMLIF